MSAVDVAKLRTFSSFRSAWSNCSSTVLSPSIASLAPPLKRYIRDESDTEVLDCIIIFEKSNIARTGSENTNVIIPLFRSKSKSSNSG